MNTHSYTRSTLLFLTLFCLLGISSCSIGSIEFENSWKLYSTTDPDYPEEMLDNYLFLKFTHEGYVSFSGHKYDDTTTPDPIPYTRDIENGTVSFADRTFNVVMNGSTMTLTDIDSGYIYKFNYSLR